MFRLVAAALGVGFASAAAGNVTTLCNQLLTGRCFAYNNIWTQTLPSQANCESWFGVFPNGQDTDNSTNSIGCRQHFASLAVDALTDYNCQFASFNGGGACGNALANTCDAVLNICSGNPNLPAGFTSSSNCQTNLTGLAAIFGSKDGVPGSTENSLNCRVYHAIAGTTVGAVHCGHVDSNGPCAGGAVTVNADHYCGVLENVCTGTNQQYLNHATCVATFATFPNGTGGVVAANTHDKPSHQYHANAASAIGPVHCSHGGPSGGGTVGTPRAAWQTLANNANCKTVAGAGYVSTQVNLAFANWSSADLLAVVPTDPNISSFTANPPNAGNYDSCRIYHLSVATVLGVHCTHGDLLGGGQCPLGHPEIPACLMQKALCGTTNYADDASCQTAYGGYFVANKTGDPNNMNPGTEDSLACRLYYVTLGLIAKNGGMTNVTAQCASAKISGSALCTGAMMTPTPMMKSGVAPVALSAAVSFLMLLW